MRPELKHIEQIERYLEGDLNSSEKREFERKMAADATLRADVQLQRQVVQQVRETAFLAELEQAHQTFAHAPSHTTTPRPRWVWSSLLLLLLGASGAGIWWTTHSTSSIPVVEQEVLLPSATPTPAVTSAVPEQWLANAQTPYHRKRLTAQSAQHVVLQGINATLSIPANALTDANGNLVNGDYELTYRSLKHPSNQAAAGLPLFYEGQTAQGIESAALLDLHATQDGQPLQLAEGHVLELDLTLPERQEDLSWYHLDKQQWKKQEQPVIFPEKGAYTEELDQLAYQKALVDYQNAVEERERGITRTGNTYDAGKTALLPKDIKKLPEIERPNRRSYLVRHYDNPRLVRGLRLASFGVYNCGRAYQVHHQVAVAARYTDAQQRVIDNGSVLSVVDLDANAAYSFEPSQFICNGKANNVFLLWTTEGKLYSFVKLATVDLKTGAYSFRMEQLTHRIKAPEDLRDYLDFVQQKTIK